MVIFSYYWYHNGMNLRSYHRIISEYQYSLIGFLYNDKHRSFMKESVDILIVIISPLERSLGGIVYRLLDFIDFFLFLKEDRLAGLDCITPVRSQLQPGDV